MATKLAGNIILFQNVADFVTSADTFYLIYARVAQSVEHWSNKPTVAGSIPVVSNQEKLAKTHLGGPMV